MALGKLVRGALYVHREAIDGLAEVTRAKIDQAAAKGTPRWNVARVKKDVVALLEYEDFDTAAFPRLIASTRVELATGRHTRTDFSRSDNPPILHRKEQLLMSHDPRVARWTETTRKLEAKGMFKDSYAIGRRKAWTERLAAAGLSVVGDEVVIA
jgi:DNA phosphorothioation-associated putative methyltransferase